MKTNIELHIDELVLRGLPGAQRDHIAAAVEAELQRLLDESGLPPSLAEGARLPEVQLDNLRLAAGVKPAAIGVQVAGAIYQNLTGSRTLTGSSGRKAP